MSDISKAWEAAGEAVATAIVGLNGRMDRLETRMDRLDARMDQLDARMDRFEAAMSASVAMQNRMLEAMQNLQGQMAAMQRMLGQRLSLPAE